MKIMITGSRGYVAANLKKYIEANTSWQADLVSVRSSDWKAVDFGQYDAVIHAAALVHKKEADLGWQAYHQVNTLLTKEVAEKALAEGVSHFIFLSSMSVYGLEQGKITAATRPEPKGFYGKSKLEAEEGLIRLFSGQYLQMNHVNAAGDEASPAHLQDSGNQSADLQSEQSAAAGAGMTVSTSEQAAAAGAGMAVSTSEQAAAADGNTPLLSIIRPPMVYGPDCPGNFSRLRRLAGMTPVFPKLHNQRSMIYIENL